MKNRTVIGLLCIVMALALAFGIAPLVNKFADSRTDIVRLKRDITQGHLITEDDIEAVTVGSHNLPAEVVTDPSLVTGKYASLDMRSGDYFFPSKLSDSADSASDIFKALGGQMAISVTIKSFAGGLSGKLANGDIVSLVVYSNDGGEEMTSIPPELTYVRVITSTTSGGLDKDELVKNEDGTYELPTTLTLLVNERQAQLLTEYENTGRIHAALVCRGDAEKAEELLAHQAGILAVIEEEEKNNV